MRVEFLVPPGSLSQNAEPIISGLRAAAAAEGDRAVVTPSYQGEGEVLCLYGVGAPERDEARKRHVASGRHVFLWDLGYFGPNYDRSGYMRCSIDHDHPQAYLDKTQPEPSRWDAIGLTLRHDYDPAGPVILIGLGRKSRKYLNEPDWEENKLGEIRDQFGDRQIIYRPKPGHPSPHLDLKTDDKTPIQALLKGASLVVCRHSNVAVDAIIAGVPYDCEDGAAIWLKQKEMAPSWDRVPSDEERLDFLRRLAWWQWKAAEARGAWAFLKGMIA